MNISRLKTFTTDRNKIIDYLKKHTAFEYENHGSEISVLMTEEFNIKIEKI
ncbi:MAG: hypothetical protein ACOX32_06495 [Bacteroidaceae bacterium]|jgi:hypothetical protein